MTISPVLSNSIVESVKLALKEDIGSGDLTAQLITVDGKVNAKIISRQTAILCGRPWASEVFRQLDPAIKQTWFFEDGDTLHPEQVICEIQGSSSPILTGERTALNFLQMLSGTATLTHQFVDAIKGTGAKILDTRKTIPGLRLAQKYAVKCGGGENHRTGLFDGVLVKENHIAASGSLEHAIQQALSVGAGVMVEVEVETLEQLQQAIDAGVKRVLLDNMSLAELEKAVKIANKRVLLEASGGVTLQNVRVIAQTGVDYISVGGITKNIDAIDLSMRFDY